MPIERPYQLAESLHALRQREIPDEIAASLAALNLGCALMLLSSDELVLNDFREETELQWPRLFYFDTAPVGSKDVYAAEQMAATFNGLANEYGSEDYSRAPVYDLMDDLFGRDSEKIKHAALALSLVCLTHRNALVRVSAAIAAAPFFMNPVRVGQILNILRQLYEQPPDELIQELAFIGLTRSFMSRAGAGGLNMTLGSGIPTSHNAVEASSREAILVHGTVFQKQGSKLDKWWEPGAGDLHRYLRSGTMPNLYRHSDYYRWSGGWNEYARHDAAEKLCEWMRLRHVSVPDVIAHSHGGNVAMLASTQENMNKLVLLSCPVHWSAYRPDKVSDVLSIRIKWDLVIMADGGAQRFPNDPRIREVILPFWFTAHDASRRSSTWKSRNLDQLV